MHIGREGSHNNTVFSVAELIVKGLAHHPFAGGKAGAFRISAVGQKGQHTTVTIFGKFIEFCNLSIHGGMVNFKVTRMNNRTNGSINSNCYSVGNAVIYADKIELKGSSGNFIAGLNNTAVFGAHTVFLQTALQNAQSKCGAIYGAINLLHNIGQRSNMILMTMSQKDTL